MSSTLKNYTSVASFYNGKSVFITGATGFLGKLLVEKLLYNCNGIEKIYILLRAKNGLTLDQRVQKIIESPAFERLKNSRPDDLKKIVPVAGELTASGLGLSTEDEQTLLNNVSVVFHSAATVSFDEPLSVALAINLEGSIKVLDLCKRMPNIQALVHVSTAYSNTDQAVVEERVYPPPAAISDVYSHLKRHGDDEEATIKLLNGRPNTYCFTKALTEAYLAEHRGHVPTVIVRPSIVTPSMKEPMEGWVESWQGATLILTAGARGFQRVMLAEPRGVGGLIPVDYVVNMAILAARYSKKEEISVYNCCTSTTYPVSWQTMSELFQQASKADNFQQLPFPQVVMTRSHVVFSLLRLFGQTIPAYLMDAARLLKGAEPIYVRMNARLLNLTQKLQYFSTRNWAFQCGAAQALDMRAASSLTDASRFRPLPAQIHWPSYMQAYFKGVKKYLIRRKYNPLEIQ